VQQYIVIDSYIPIVIFGDKMQKFKNKYLIIDIKNGILIYKNLHQLRRKFVVLLKHLLLFMEIWKYFDISYLGLNLYLRLILII